MDQGRSSIRAFSTIAIVLFLVGGGIIAYYMVYVQSRQASLTRLRFQAIAQIGERVKARFDAIDALRKSPRADPSSCQAPPNAADFLGLRMYSGEAGTSAGFTYKQTPVYKELAGGDPYLVAPMFENSEENRKCQVRVHLRKMFSASITRDLFDDYALVLLPGTDFLYQHRIETNGRISQLTTLLRNDKKCPSGKLLGDNPKEEKPDDSKQEPAGVPPSRVCVMHQGEDYQVFTQLVAVEGLGPVNEADTEPIQLLVVGMLRQDRLLSEARGVSSTWLQILASLLLMAILAAPFLKLHYVGGLERLRALDVQIAAVAAVIAGGFLTIIVVNAYSHHSQSKKLDDELKVLARKVSGNFRNELSQALTELCRHTGLDQPELDEVRYPHFSNLLAIDKDGKPCAGLKLDEVPDAKNNCPRKQLAPLGVGEVPDLNLEDRQYFIRARQRERSRLWTLDGMRFAATSLQSRASGEKTAVVAVPYGVRCDRPETCEDDDCRRIPGDMDCVPKVMVLAGRLRSVIEPVVPLGFGFAIIGEDGEVLFHSDSARNTEENLFVESDQAELLRSLVSARLADHVDARYDGSEHRFYVEGLPDIRWFVVTFRSKEFWREVRFGISGLAALSFVAYVAFLLLLFLISRILGVLPEKYRAEWLWPNPDMTFRYAAGALFLLVFSLATIAMASFYAARFGSVFLIVVPPILGIVLVRIMLRRSSRATGSYRSASFRRAYYAFLSALLLVLAITPAIVAYEDAYSLGMTSLLKRREEALAGRLRSRTDSNENRLRCYENGSGRLDWYETLDVHVRDTNRPIACEQPIRPTSFLDHDAECTSPKLTSTSRGEIESWFCDPATETTGAHTMDAAPDSLAGFLLEGLSSNARNRIELFRDSRRNRSSDESWGWAVDDGILTYTSCGNAEMERFHANKAWFRLSGPIEALRLPQDGFDLFLVLVSLAAAFWVVCQSARRVSVLDAETNEDYDTAKPPHPSGHRNPEVSWELCSQEEKLALLQLAEEGFINPNRPRITRNLTRSGLIQRLPALTLDPKFRRFVLGALSEETVRKLEQGGRPSVWLELRTPLAALFLLVAGFFLLTQPDVFNSAVGIATALAAALPFILRILGSLGTTKQESGS
jgi:hypothetical protein